MYKEGKTVTPRTGAHQAFHRDSPGKNTGAGRHALLWEKGNKCIQLRNIVAFPSRYIKTLIFLSFLPGQHTASMPTSCQQTNICAVTYIIKENSPAAVDEACYSCPFMLHAHSDIFYQITH